MKKIVFLVFLCLFIGFHSVHAQQSVGIGTNTPNPRSVLELVSPGQNQGFLLPRLSTTEINAIAPVAADQGLMVFDNVTNEVKYWNGSAWVSLGVAGGGITSLNGLNTASQTFVTGAAGTNFNIVSSGSTHTFNFPNASSTNRGLLTSADWTLFNSKQAALTFGNLTSSTTGLSITGGTGSVIGAGTTINIQNANGTQPGLLTAADWATFNDKLGNSLLSGQLLIGSAGNLATPQTLSGDATLANTGVLTIANSAVTSAKILDGTITNADVNAAAAVAGTKINPDFGGQNIVTTGTARFGITGINSATLPGTSLVVGNNTTQAALIDGSMLVNGLISANAGINVINSLYANGSSGTSDQVLTSQGLGLPPVWSTFDGWRLTGNAGTNPTTNFIGTTDAQPLRFATGIGGIERMRITPSGNIGIGTSTPATELHVSGNASVIRIEGVDHAYLEYFNEGPATRTGWIGYGTASATALSITNEMGEINLSTGLGASFERVSITSAGNVGIGTLSPTERLDVVGNVRFSGALMPNGLAGTTNQVLTSLGPDVAPEWRSVSGFSTLNRVPRGDGSTLVASAIQDNGTNTGIGIAPNATARLLVNNTGSGVSAHGVFAQASGATNNIGAWGTVSGGGTTTDNYGIYGEATGTSVRSYGVYGRAVGGTINWAGYFDQGNVHISNALSVGAIPGTFGTAGQVLTSAGAGSPPTWQSATVSTWGLTGNAGTIDGTNFIGSTDAIPFTIRTNNIRSARLEPGANGNAFFGFEAGLSVPNNSTSTAIGYQALRNAAVGSQNTAIGFRALNVAFGAIQNVAVGMNALLANTSGSQNTGVGYGVLSANLDGLRNVAVGMSALNANTTGDDNVSVGYQSLLSNLTGDFNVGIGSQALQNTTASNNVGIGVGAGALNTSGTNNTYIGSGANATVNNLTNATAIGANASVSQSNSLILGNNANVGIGTSTPGLQAGSNRYLSLAGPSNGFDNRTASLEIVGNTPTTDALASKVDFLGILPPTNEILQRARLEARSGNGATGAGQLVFYTNTGISATSIVERMRIRENGSVGIGTIGLPTALLSIGTGNAFQIGSTGNLQRINNVPYTWPNANSNGVLTNDGAGSLVWAPVPATVILGGNGITVTGSTIDLGGTMTFPITPLSSTTDNRILIQSSNAAINTVAGVRLRMFETGITKQWDILSRKRDNVANSGQSDFLINNVFSAAGGFIESFKIDGSNSNVIINADKTSASPYGNFIVANGNTGIGTTTPFNLLGISGAIPPTAGNNEGVFLDLHNSLGSANHMAGIRFKVNSFTTNERFNAGIFYRLNPSVVGELNFAIKSIASVANISASDIRMTLAETGNLGIGTTVPASRVHVAGSNTLASRAAGTLLDINTTTLNVNAYMRFTQDGPGLQNPFFVGVDFDNGISELWNQDALPMRFGTSNAERMRITGAGNVGIGISTPLNTFHVATEAMATSENVIFEGHSATSTRGSGINYRRSRGTIVTPAAVVSGDYLGGMTASGRTSTAYNTSSSIQFEVDAAVAGTSVPGRITFGTTTALASTPTERLRINSEGNVGIGTTVPDSRLHVAENVSDLTGADGAFVDIQNLFTSASTGFMSGIRFRTDGVGAGADARFKGGIFFRKTGSFGVGDLIFATRNTADNASVNAADASMTILSTGNVGIGTSAPVRLLDIRSTGFQAARIASTDNTGAAFELVRPGTTSNDFRLLNNGVLRIQYGGNTDDLFGGALDLMTINTLGNVAITGSLSKASGTFKIDHPSDPANKYLVHSFVESPDMMNVYNGNIVTNVSGEAVVSLPNYFGTLNKDFRYQLTPIGVFSQAIILEEINENTNSFKIKTDQPNVKVSWQVTGVRKDPYANANRIKDVVEKSPEERGFYLHPQLYGQPIDKHIGRAPVRQEYER